MIWVCLLILSSIKYIYFTISQSLRCRLYYIFCHYKKENFQCRNSSNFYALISRLCPLCSLDLWLLFMVEWQRRSTLQYYILLPSHSTYCSMLYHRMFMVIYMYLNSYSIELVFNLEWIDRHANVDNQLRHVDNKRLLLLSP